MNISSQDCPPPPTVPVSTNGQFLPQSPIAHFKHCLLHEVWKYPLQVVGVCGVRQWEYLLQLCTVFRYFKSLCEWIQSPKKVTIPWRTRIKGRRACLTSILPCLWWRQRNEVMHVVVWSCGEKCSANQSTFLKKEDKWVTTTTQRESDKAIDRVFVFFS